MNKTKVTIYSLIFLVFAINIFFGFPRLTDYSSVDEPYWTYDRTPDFWNAIREQKWKNTKINDKPGITVAEISGIGLLSGIKPLEYKSIRQEAKTPEISQSIKKINFFLRLPIYLASLLILGFYYFFIKKLLNRPIAMIALIFIAFSPIILGISLIINPDSLLWGFLPLSILSYLVYQKESTLPENKHHKKYLVIAGIFLGLSLLTKYVANILYVYIFGLLFLDYIYLNTDRKKFAVYIKKSLLDYGILVLVSLIVFFVLFPACWVEPKILLDGTIFSVAFKSTWPIFVGFIGLILADSFFLKARIFSWAMNFISAYRQYFKVLIGSIFIVGIIFVFINTYTGMKVFNFEGEMASPKGENALTLLNLATVTTSDLYALLFAIAPLVLFCFLWAVIKNTFQRGVISNESAIVSYFLIFIILYYVASTANNVTATVRYQIVLYPLALIIASIGLYQISQVEKIKKYLNANTFYVVAILISIPSFYFSSPFFFNYSSILLPEKYILNFKDMGDGSFEAARYLNSLPNAQNLIIWSDKGAVCETFLGTCKVSFNKNDTVGFDFDYFVVSTGRKSRSLKLEGSTDFKNKVDFQKLYMSGFENADFEIIFGENPNNFVRVVKTEKIIKVKK
ncbi:MAG: phospholipid carrier-dependent glycosyltransferase [Candidatus Moraniibacteriota bacterium]